MAKQRYPETQSSPDFPKIEEQVLARWEKDGTFRESIALRDIPSLSSRGVEGANAESVNTGSTQQDVRDPGLGALTDARLGRDDNVKKTGLGNPGSLESAEGGTLSASKEGYNNEWVFYDGPPFANGLPHYGHLLTSCVKDIFARYHTMKGEKVERRFGWDCHGLPAEMGAEKELGVSGRKAIEDFGIDKFNDHCRTSVMKYTEEWQRYVTRAARWVDFEHDYKTMDTDYMESVLWAFKQLYDKGLVYESHRVMPYSWAAETPLSNFETRMDDAYRERTDKAVTVAFKLKEKPKGAPDAEEYYILAWTTTPWTLPSNLALAVKGDMEYACILSSPLAGEHDAPQHISGGKTDFATEKAQAMRKEPTEAEKTLWYKLGKEQLGGYKFRRQQPIGNYIVDFYNAEERLVIELDGGQHADNPKDKERTAWLEAQGVKILRFWNNEVSENLDGVLQTILDTLEQTSHAVSAPEGLETAAPPQGGSRRVCYITADFAWGFYAKELNFKTEFNPKYLDASLSDEEREKLIKEEANQFKRLKGSSLISLSYEPLFPYFADTENAFKILEGDFIEEGSGTGVVHLAPGFGEDDQRVCAENGIGIVCPVDESGKYTDEIFDLPCHPEQAKRVEGSQVAGDPSATGVPLSAQDDTPPLSLKGLNVIAQKEGQCANEPYKPEQLEKYGLVNLRITNWLKMTGKLIKQEDYVHSYPHCWRTDTPLIYRALPSWYVEVTKFRDRMVELNKDINWIPEHIKDGQFGKWLEGARDWSISRNRFWGTPIPVWRTESGKIKVFGSIAELEEFFGVEVKDLHKPFIDSLAKEEDGETWRRVPDVFDCWFESGSMPFAQVHYPFENKDWFETHFPADFIVEYVGQTRGWFYTLMVLGTALFDKPPFKNCICHGVILDANGKKLSKKLRNYPDPFDMFDQYGADAMRWRMVKEPIMHGGNLLIRKDGNDIRDVVRLSIKPIWNAYHFFCLYANADGVEAKEILDSVNSHMDRYILLKCKKAVEKIDIALTEFMTPEACKEIDDFFEVLTNWYIRRSRDRFWGSEYSENKQVAYDTLYTVLITMAKAAAPLLPLTMEEIYQGLTGKSSSVHLADWPDVSQLVWNTKGNGQRVLELSMDNAKEACNAALAVRETVGVRVRQPLPKLTLVTPNAEILSELLTQVTDVIKDEVNVKEVSLTSNLDAFATRICKINFPVAGKRLGPKMKVIAAAAKQGDWKALEDGKAEVGGEVLEADEFEIALQPKEGIVGAQALPTNDALVVLDLEITPELAAEGMARDVVRMIQQARKDADLTITDRIRVVVDAPESIQQAVAANEDYVKEQTLTSELTFKKANGAAHIAEGELEGAKIIIGFDVAA